MREIFQETGAKQTGGKVFMISGNGENIPGDRPLINAFAGFVIVWNFFGGEDLKAVVL